MPLSTFSSINRVIYIPSTPSFLYAPPDTSTKGLIFGYEISNNCYCISADNKFQLQSGTLECWIKCPVATGGSADNGWRGLVTANPNFAMVIFGRKLGTFIFGTGVTLTGGSFVNDNNWHHCVMTFQNGGNCFLYLDGGQVATAPYTAGTTSPLRIGTGATDLQRCMCDIKNVCVYNTILSPANILSNYNVTHTTMPAVNVPGLIGRFTLKEGSGTVAINTASGSTEGNLNIYRTTSINNTAGGVSGTQSTTFITNSYWYP